MPQTLVISDPPASRFDLSQQVVVRSWKDCGCDVAWVQVVGELDLVTSPALEQALRDAELRAPVVVLDLRELTFTDSSGVRVITNASARVARAGRRLVLVRGPAQADRMLALIASDVPEIVDLDPGEPVAHALSQLARQAHAACTATAAPTQSAKRTAATPAEDGVTCSVTPGGRRFTDGACHDVDVAASARKGVYRTRAGVVLDDGASGTEPGSAPARRHIGSRALPG
jgi:anti-sigma B factor antagonist